MRLLLAAAILASIASVPAMPQSCETISVRNAAGQVTSSKEICADENGNWIDPATVIQGSLPVPITGDVFAKNPREIVAKPAKTVWQPVLMPEALPFEPAPAITIAPAIPIAPPISVAPPPPIAPPITIAPPTPVAPAIQIAPLIQPDPYPVPVEYVNIEPTQPEVQIAPLAPVETRARDWQPTSGNAQRQDLYAKLGLVCVAKQAMFCDSNNCTGLCTAKSGWCDGKTGETYQSLAAIERVYCRKIKRR